ncbi:hypothetical protein LTR17_027876, partial [Elasticomyces elasticus]
MKKELRDKAVLEKAQGLKKSHLDKYEAAHAVGSNALVAIVTLDRLCTRVSQQYVITHPGYPGYKRRSIGWAETV